MFLLLVADHYCLLLWPNLQLTESQCIVSITAVEMLIKVFDLILGDFNYRADMYFFRSWYIFFSATEEQNCVSTKI